MDELIKKLFKSIRKSVRLKQISGCREVDRVIREIERDDTLRKEFCKLINKFSEAV